MSKFKRALKDMPKKPQTPYLKIRSQKMLEYAEEKYEGNKSEKFKEYWEGVA